MYGKDAYIISYIFDYKLKKVEEVYMCGFPQDSYNKVIAKLEEKKINYMILVRRNNYEIDEFCDNKNLNTYTTYFEKAKWSLKIGKLLLEKEEKKEHAQTFLKEAINSIFCDKNLCNESLYDNDIALAIIEKSYLCLAQAYVSSKEYDTARETIKDYKELMEKEFNFKYTPLISEAKSKGEKIKMLNNMIEFKSKYSKADILLVSIASLENAPDAIEQYDNLLKNSGIVLSDEERNKSIRIKCNENGTYVRIGPNNSTIQECEIIGAEDLMIKRQILQEKAIEEAKAKFAKEI